MAASVTLAVAASGAVIPGAAAARNDAPRLHSLGVINGPGFVSDRDRYVAWGLREGRLRLYDAVRGRVVRDVEVPSKDRSCFIIAIRAGRTLIRCNLFYSSQTFMTVRVRSGQPRPVPNPEPLAIQYYGLGKHWFIGTDCRWRPCLWNYTNIKTGAIRTQPLAGNPDDPDLQGDWPPPDEPEIVRGGPRRRWLYLVRQGHPRRLLQRCRYCLPVGPSKTFAAWIDRDTTIRVLRYRDGRRFAWRLRPLGGSPAYGSVLVQTTRNRLVISRRLTSKVNPGQTNPPFRVMTARIVR